MPGQTHVSSGIGRHRSPLPSAPPLVTHSGAPHIVNPFLFLTPNNVTSPSARRVDAITYPIIATTLPSNPINYISTAQSASQFLESRKAASANQRKKLLGVQGGLENAIIAKRRTQIFGTVQQAKDRMLLLGKEHEKKSLRNKFAAGCIGRLRHWLYMKRQQHLAESGKGMVLMRLWVTSLMRMEGDYGSSMMLTFSFLRWMFLLNAVLSLLWLFVIIIPFWIKPPSSFSWAFIRRKRFLQFLQGQDLEKTFFFYGGYYYSREEQKGWYRADYMYPVAIGATFLISLIAVLGRLAGKNLGSGNLGVTGRIVMYPFSSLAFASWDFHITSVEAAAKVRRGIRMQLREMLGDIAEKDKKRGLRDFLMSPKRFTALFVLWPTLMGGTVASVVILVTRAEAVNNKLGSRYAQAVLLSIVNIIGPILVRLLVGMEEWKPSTAERVLLLKLFLLRLLNLITLVYRLYFMLSQTVHSHMGLRANPICSAKDACPEGFICCTKANATEWELCTEVEILNEECLPGCGENTVGAQLLRLILITTLINNAYELIWGYGYVCLINSRRQLMIEDMVIDIVYVQAIVWVGSCFSPIASFLGFVSNLVTFYCMRVVLLTPIFWRQLLIIFSQQALCFI